MRIGILSSHPIQYQAPWFRALSQQAALQVFFAHKPTAVEQGAGFGQAFQWDVDLLAGYSNTFLRNVARRPDAGRFLGCDTPEVQGVIRQANFDAFIVTGWQLKCHWQAVRACRRARIPVLVRGESQLVTPRSRVKRLLKEVLYRPLLRQFSGFLVIGRRNRDYLLHYGADPDRLFSAPYFVDNDWFGRHAEAARSQRQGLRRSWGASESTLVALFVGKLIAKKHPGDLLEAASRLNRKGVDLLAVLVGAGELESELRAKASRESIRVAFAGFKNQSQLPACYAAADVLVLPSDGGETWGLVVNEAMACGTPALVSDAVGCGPDLIEEGQTGFTFALADTAALAEALSQIQARKAAGHDWSRALKAKLRAYDVETAVQGTLQAVVALSPATRPASQLPPG